MFKSIYKRFVEDFAFVSEYGFSYAHDLKHNIVPTVAFNKEDQTLIIGFNYEEHKMHFQWYPYPFANHGYGVQLSDTISWEGKSYKEQVERAKQFVREFLNSEINKKS